MPTSIIALSLVPLLDSTTQLLLVENPSFNASAATAQRYERARPGARWRKVGKDFPVVLGRSGLGWRTDTGAPAPLVPGPQKHEGDGRAPAGVLPLGGMWGYAAAAPAGVRLPYHQAAADDRCIDDVAAPDYGRLVPGAGAVKGEEMRRADDLYRYLIVVGYNMDRPVRGAGSCIFLHLQSPTGAPTAGCTAMAEEHLLELSRWLEPRRHPVLVQLPSEALGAARKAWGIP